MADLDQKRRTVRVLELLSESFEAHMRGDDEAFRRALDEAMGLDAFAFSGIQGGIVIGEIPNPERDWPLRWSTSRRTATGWPAWKRRTAAMTIDPPGRSLVGAEYLEPEQDGQVRVLLTCDCATSTDLTVQIEGTGTAEAAYICDGCQTVHWFTITAKGDKDG